MNHDAVNSLIFEGATQAVSPCFHSFGQTKLTAHCDIKQKLPGCILESSAERQRTGRRSL